MSPPAVTFLMPLYNPSCSQLKQAVSSVLEQTFEDLQLFIIDDCSTRKDHFSFLKELEKHPKVSIRVNSNNLGLIRTLNLGIESINSPYVARMDQDDVCCKDRIQKQIDLLREENLDLVFTQIELIDENGGFISYWSDDKECNKNTEIKKRLLRTNCLAHPTALIKTSLFKRHKYRLNQEFAEDYGLWLELAGNGRKFGKVEEVLLRYRIHQKSMCQKASGSWDSLRNPIVQIKYLLSIRKIPSLFDVRLAFYVWVNFFRGLKLAVLKRSQRIWKKI